MSDEVEVLEEYQVVEEAEETTAAPPVAETNGHKEFDINDPALLEENADDIDPDIDADDLPPPPPDAVYTLNYDFAQTELEKAFVIKTYRPKNSEKDVSFLMTSLIGTIVACDKEDIPERAWKNRKLRATITSIAMGETSSLTDWLKSVGCKAAVQEAARVKKGPGSKQKQFKIYHNAIVDAIANGAQGKATTQWKASYKRTDADGKDEYVRPGGKANDGTKFDSKHPINRYKRESDFPMRDKELSDGTIVKVRNPEVSFIDTDSGESVTARANAEIGKFIPAR